MWRQALLMVSHKRKKCAAFFPIEVLFASFSFKKRKKKKGRRKKEEKEEEKRRKRKKKKETQKFSA